MIVFRALAFAFFIAVAAGMVLWQVLHLHDAVGQAASAWHGLGAVVFGIAALLVQAFGARALNDNNRMKLLVLAGLPLLPLTALVGGVLSLVQARGGMHRRIWEGTLTVGALLSLNVALPILIGIAVLGGTEGLALAWITVRLIFFVVVDYFLARSILHYFNSGASAFVSLRYLRRRVLSLLSVFGVCLGVLVLIVVNSVMSGFQTEFREQMRGSLSHLLVRMDGGQIQGLVDPRAMRAAEWASYVERIETTPAMYDDWQAALDLALRFWREQNRDLMPDPVEFLPGQAPLPPDPEDPDDPQDPDTPATELTDEERDFINRLRTGRNLTYIDRELLRDPARGGGQITTPREFYLARIANLDTDEGRRLRDATEDRVRRDWYAPLFREALQVEFDKAEAVLRAHTGPDGRPDVEGVSWRVSTKTLITPRSGARELYDAELIGVDVLRENEISELGAHVGAAELQHFREQYVLGPLLNLLGATLGWEDPDTIDERGPRPMFLFQPFGDGDEPVPIGSVPRDMHRYLGSRGLATMSGRIYWNEFDRVKFTPGTPGQPVYRAVRDAYRRASRTEDLGQLARILAACERDVRNLLAPIAAAPREEATTHIRQSSYRGARVLMNEFLTGTGPVVDAIENVYHEHQLPLFHEIRNFPSEASAERDWLSRIHKALWEGVQEAQTQANRTDIAESERDAVVRTLVQGYAEIYAAALADAEGKDWRNTELVRQLRARALETSGVQPLQRRANERRPLPLSYAVEFFEQNAEYLRVRLEAYRQVLPLRTTMRDGESIEQYVARATTPGLRPEDDQPGIILGDALAEMALGAGANVGDSIAITIPRIYWENNRLVPRTSEVWFRITGFFRGGLYEENRARMYCDFEELSSILADTEIRFTVGARFADYSPYEGRHRSERLKQDIREALREARVSTIGVSVWEDETRTLLDAVNVERTLIGLIVSFIIALTGGVIFILVYQLVHEKVKDIGILKALGYSPWGIRSVFMFNALFIGLFGAAGGAVLGVFTSEYLNQIEDFIDRATGIRLFPPEIYFLTYIPSVKGPELVRLALDIAVPVVLFSFLCGIYPAMLAAKKDPVEALHYE